ncbi:MAG: lactonase family protein [Defluviitaleaceae bacterium]|nr:lactonase family protein [Defluviitaleaceae bacterium]MCL2836971.1 lactonase family protein [Defluviitaleaceae bacterium]
MKYTVYFGTYSKSLYRGEFDAGTGGLELLDSADVENPSYLHADGDVLYGVSETDVFNGKSGGALFSVSLRDEKMEVLSIEGTNGRHPCHLSVFGNYIFVSNYSEGTLSIFEKDIKGRIKPSRLSVAHYGSSVNPSRQKQAHIHFAAMSPDFQYLAVCDLGLDKVFAYPFTMDYGLSLKAKEVDCPPGSGPRHLVFSRDGRTMYVLTELSNTILVYQSIKDNIELVQEISALPDGFTGAGGAAAIHMSPDVGFIAASNRGHDSVAVFRINGGGTLQKPEFIMTGAAPRDFGYSPDGRWILSANQNDNTVTVHSVRETSETAGQINVPSPCCIAFGGLRAKPAMAEQ